MALKISEKGSGKMYDAISRSKLLEWLDVEIELSRGNDPVLRADVWAFQHVKNEAESGRLDIDKAT
jgi:hypothetical protein